MNFIADLPKSPGTYRHRWIDHAGRMKEQTLKNTKYVRRNAKRNLYLWRCADAIRALAKESIK